MSLQDNLKKMREESLLLADDLKKIEDESEKIRREIKVAEHLARALQYVVRAASGSCTATPLCAEKALIDRNPLCLSCEAKEILKELLESKVLELAPVATQDEPERPTLPKPPASNYR